METESSTLLDFNTLRVFLPHLSNYYSKFRESTPAYATQKASIFYSFIQTGQLIVTVYEIESGLISITSLSISRDHSENTTTATFKNHGKNFIFILETSNF